MDMPRFQLCRCDLSQACINITKGKRRSLPIIFKSVFSLVNVISKIRCMNSIRHP